MNVNRDDKYYLYYPSIFYSHGGGRYFSVINHLMVKSALTYDALRN
jgi:hypothetical protein